MKRNALLAVALLFVLWVMAPPAVADSIDFMGGTGGSVNFTYALGSTFSLTGAPLNLFFLGSSLSPIPINSGALSFVTGPATSISGTTITFGPGGNLTVTGGVYGLPSTTPLVTGQFQSAGVAVWGSLGFFGGLFSVTDINATLLSNLFPGSTNPIDIGGGTLAQVFYGGLSLNPGSYSGTVGSSNLLVSIQEPQTLFLLGAGLMVAAGLLRWKLSPARAAKD